LNRESYFVAIDGDKVGRKIEQLLLMGNLIDLSNFSQNILAAMKTLEFIILEAGGKVHMIGGDNLLAEVSNIDLFISNFTPIRDKLVCSFCIGIGTDPIRAYLALKFAKSCAPETIVQAEEVGRDIQFRKLL
jgi:GTP cyclohydrolase III